MSITERVLAEAERLGFAMCGVARAEASPHAEEVRRWIETGSHGEMQYLAEHLDVRLDPRRLVPGARSVIVVADRYPSQPPLPGAVPVAASQRRALGKVGRYAWGDDYHKVIKKRLFALADTLREAHPSETFRSVVDTAPLLEREFAVRAGLGWIGKHTLMIHPQPDHRGSWYLLGCIVTTLDLPPTAEQHPGEVDHCGSCTRCIDACPTHCIEDPAVTGRRSLDATRCISYLTLEHRSLIPPELHEPMGDWIAGCDVCQEVCPFNWGSGTGDRGSGSQSGVVDSTIHDRYQPRPELTGGLDLLDLLGWSSEDRAETFRGSALKRMKLEMVKRNALIAAGNALRTADDPSLHKRIEQIAADETEHELVRETARQGLDGSRSVNV